MKTYRVHMAGGGEFLIRADMGQASAPIAVAWWPDEWQSTGYQTADAHHDLEAAALLAWRHDSPPDERDDSIESIEDEDEDEDEDDDRQT